MEKNARAMFSLPAPGCIFKHDIQIIDNYRIKLAHFSSVNDVIAYKIVDLCAALGYNCTVRTASYDNYQ